MRSNNSNSSRPLRERLAERMNANTLTVVTGSPFPGLRSVSAMILLRFLMTATSCGYVPVISQGAFQNVRDVRYLYGRGVSVFAQTTSSAINRRTGEMADIGDKIVYIAIDSE
jgi:hypothetical protein